MPPEDTQNPEMVLVPREVAAKEANALAQLGEKHSDNIKKLQDEEAELQTKIENMQSTIGTLEMDIAKKKANREVALEEAEAAVAKAQSDADDRLAQAVAKEDQIEAAWEKIDTQSKDVANRLTKIIEREHLAEDAEGKNQVKKEQLDERESKIMEEEARVAERQLHIIAREETTFNAENELLQKQSEFDAKVELFEKRVEEFDEKDALREECEKSNAEITEKCKARCEELDAREAKVVEDERFNKARAHDNDYQYKVNEDARMKINKILRDRQIDKNKVLPNEE